MRGYKGPMQRDKNDAKMLRKYSKIKIILNSCVADKKLKGVVAQRVEQKVKRNISTGIFKVAVAPLLHKYQISCGL
jgi:hypothetical protein